MKLLPCPFCGNSDIKLDNSLSGGLTCRKCGCQIDYSYCYNNDELIEKWNTRTPIVQQRLSNIKTSDSRKRCTKEGVKKG